MPNRALTPGKSGLHSDLSLPITCEQRQEANIQYSASQGDRFSPVPKQLLLTWHTLHCREDRRMPLPPRVQLQVDQVDGLVLGI